MWREDAQPDQGPTTSEVRSPIDPGYFHEPEHTHEPNPQHIHGPSPEHAHDPSEVTIQLDVVQGGEARAAHRPARHRAGAGPRAADRPVFVDESGRRSRRLRRLGVGVGAVCALYAGVIAATLLSGNSDAPWLPVPGQQEDAPAAEVRTSPTPSASGSATGLPGATPGATGSAATGATASSATNGTRAPSASAGAVDPDASSRTLPSASGSTAPTQAEETTGSTGPTESAAVSPATGTSQDPTGDPSPSSSAADGGTDSGGTVSDSLP